MDSVEKRISEKLGFRIEVVEIPDDKGDTVTQPLKISKMENGQHFGAASKAEVALWDALLASERSREWVKVSERKPEKDGRYLVVRCGTIEFNFWSCREQGWTLRIPIERSEIELWQHIPALPSEGD